MHYAMLQVVCCKVQTNLTKKMIYLYDLSGDELDEDRMTESWTNSIDRGGLWYVRDALMIFSTALKSNVDVTLL